MVKLDARAVFLRLVVLGLLIIVGGALLPPSSGYLFHEGVRQGPLESQGTTTVTLEYFSGEESFKDGYDFSEGVKVRFYSASGPRPSGYNPDFYLEIWEYTYNANHQMNGEILGPIIAAEGNFAAMPDRGWLRTIDYGVVRLDSVNEVPDRSDARFKVQGFLVGHTYGLFTKEGDYVLLHVDSQYPFESVSYKDWYKDGITFTWRYASAGTATTTTATTTSPANLYLTVSSDSLTYSPGETAVISGHVYADGKPIGGAVVTLKAYTESGEILQEGSVESGQAGGFEWSLHLPDRPGSVRVEVTVSYGGSFSTSDLTLTVSGGGGKLSLELYYPPSSINSGDYFGIGGCVEYGGSPVKGANVYVAINGPVSYVQESKYTQTGDKGCFLQEFETDKWPPGDYTLSVYVDAGYRGNISKEFRFRVGKVGLSVEIEAASTYPQYSAAEVTIVVKSEGRPVGGAPVRYNVTGPSGWVDWGGGITDSEGKLKVMIKHHGRETLVEAGDYVIEVLATASGGLRGRAEAKFTVTPAKKPSTLTYPKFAWVNYTKLVETGGTITITGMVVDEDTNESVDAIVNATIFEVRSTKSFGFKTVNTSSGKFTLKLDAPENVSSLEIIMTATAPGSSEYSDVYIASVYVLTRLKVDVRLNKDVYSPGEFVAAKVTIRPLSPSYHREPGIWAVIRGPDGGVRVIAPSKVMRTKDWSWKVDMGWRIPQDASGDYELIVTVIDEYFSFLAEGRASFSVHRVDTSVLSATVVMDPSIFRSDFISGNLTDRLGNPIAGASVSLTFYEVNLSEIPLPLGGLDCSSLPGVALNDLGIREPEIYPCDYLVSAVAKWYRDKLQSLGGESISLTTTTGSDGGFTVSLEKVDLLGFKMVEKDGRKVAEQREWLVMVSAHKEGYREAFNFLAVETPTVSDGTVEIVSVDPPVDFLAKKAEGVNYNISKLAGTSVSVKIKVKYNRLGGEKGNLTVKAYGDWSIRGECSHLRLMVNVPNTKKVSPYDHSAIGEIEVSPKVGGETTVTVSGNLFDYKDLHCNIEAGSSYGGFCVYVGDVGVCYPIGVPLKRYSTDVLGEAWAKSGYREIKVGSRSFYSSGVLKAKVWVTKTRTSTGTVSDFSGELVSNSGVEIIPLADGKRTNLIKVPAQATTDEDGLLVVPINLTGSPRDLSGKTFSLSISVPGSVPDTIPVKITMQPFGGRFQIRNVRLVQAADVTSSGTLASGKLAAVHAEIVPVGYEGQESLFPVRVPVELVVSSGGEVVARSKRTVSVSFNKTNSVNLLFTPLAAEKSSHLELTIIVDPAMEFSSQLSFTKLTAVVRKMKNIALVVVPLGGLSKDAVTSTILDQIRFMEQVYPVREGGINVTYARPPSWAGKNTPWLAIALGLSFYIDSRSTSTMEYRVVGVTPPDWWSEGESGVTISSVPSVVFIKVGTSNEYVLSHEVGHTLGLYKSWIPGQRFIPIKSLKGEEYDRYPPCGLEIHGLVLKNGNVLEIPDRWDQSPASWKKGFCLIPPRAESNEELLKKFVCEVYDIMGNANYETPQRAWIHNTTYEYLMNELKDPVEGRVLTVYGVIYENGSAKLAGARPSEGIAYFSDKGIYTLREVSSSGEVLFNASFGDVAADMPFAVSLPYRPGVAEVQLLFKGKVLSTLRRSPYPPVVTRVDASWSGPTLTVRWAASDGDGDKLTYTVYYGCGGQWIPVGVTNGTSIELDGSMLPSGRCSVRVKASDGFNIGEGKSEAFQVTDRPPTVAIAMNSMGSLVKLRGMGYDPEDGLLNSSVLQWTLDGKPVGKGEELELNLTPGKHTIELIGVDSAGHSSKKSVVVDLEEVNQSKGGEGLDQLTGLLNSAWEEILRVKDSYPELFWGALAFIAILLVAVIRRRH